MGGIMPKNTVPFNQGKIPKGFNQNNILDRDLLFQYNNSLDVKEVYCFFCSKPILLDMETTHLDKNRQAHKPCLEMFMERQEQKYGR